MLPLIAAAATPIVGDLLKNGLTTLASAAANMGVEWVQKWIKDKTGIEVKPGQSLTPEQALAIKQAEMEHERELLKYALEERKIDVDLEKSTQDNLTERHKADMASDSWLSKNIRPLTLAILTLTIVFATFFEVAADKYKTLAGLGELVFAYYFVGRTIEKRPFESIVEKMRRGGDK